MQPKLSSPQDLPGEPDDSPSKLPRWTLPLFVVAMTLTICSFFIKAYWISEPIKHRMISVIETPNDFHNVTWDDLCLIPRLKTISRGKLFSDPWNSHNPKYKGWVLFSAFSIFGGALIHIFKDYFIAMSIWGVINFSLIIIFIYNIFRNHPFEFSQATSILGVFLLLNLLWLGGQEWERLDKAVPRALLAGYHFSLVELECGLFTYLPYVLFLFAYWRFLAAPGLKRSVLVGAVAGLLTYIYFFHYVFAFAMIGGHMVLSFASKNKREAAYLAGAFGLGVLVAIPAMLNSLLFAVSTAPIFHMHKIDYSPGRLPFQDYHWLLRLQVPFLIGIAYIVLRKQSEIKWVMIRTWAVLGIAYITVLHLRVFLGFMQAVDHFWRVSLGVPASLWCILAGFDLARSRLGKYEISRKLVHTAAIILPILILMRTTIDVGYAVYYRDDMSKLSGKQHEILAKLDCLENVLEPGEGFIAVDPALNYHTMVNLEGLPFMVFGLSPISVQELSMHYLISAYLTGRDNIKYPQPIDRESPDYTYEKDLHIYLYVNLFYYPWSNFNLEEQIKLIYRNWDPALIDWRVWSDSLSTVKAVYVENKNLDLAMERLEKLFAIEQIVSCGNAKVIRVNYNWD